MHPRPRYACLSFAGHPSDLTFRPTRQASPHAHACPTAIRSPVGRRPEPAAEHGAHPLLHWLADLSLINRAHRERRLRWAVITIDSLHCLEWYVWHFDIAFMLSKGVARGTASLADKSVLLAIAVRGLQSRRREMASEWSCVRSKFEQACASNVVAMLACGVVRRASRISSVHGRTRLTLTPANLLCVCVCSAGR